MAPPVEINLPLRKCRVCGLEAWIKEELQFFIKDNSCSHGRQRICRKCKTKEALYRIKHPKLKIILPYLRKCTDCGLEAYTGKGLELFATDKKRPYGRVNLCKKCKKLYNDGYKKQHPLMAKYTDMKKRCYDPKSDSYYLYGGRGIAVCEEWLLDSNKFYEWARNNGFKLGLTIDRIDNDSSYSPENCRWVTHSENQRNRRNNVTDWEKDTRICEKCKVEKPLLDFHHSRKHSMGRNYVCKECIKKRSNKYNTKLNVNLNEKLNLSKK